jgi:hypothetical protein
MVQFLFSLSYLVVSFYEYYLQVPATSAWVLAAKIVVFRIVWPIKDLVTSILLAYLFYSQSVKAQASREPSMNEP